jgi:hypothetical protein
MLRSAKLLPAGKVAAACWRQLRKSNYNPFLLLLLLFLHPSHYVHLPRQTY